MKSYHAGVIYIILSAFGFGVMPIFAIYAYKGGIDVFTLLFIRFVLGASIFQLYLRIKKIRYRFNRRELLTLLLLGGVCYTLQSSMYLLSVQYISPSLAALLLYLYPAVVTLLSFLLNQERVTKQILFSLAVSLAGAVLVLGTSYGNINILGVLLAFGATTVYSFYILLGSRILKRIPPLVVSSYVTLFSCLGTFILVLASGGFSFHFTPETWIPIWGIVIFSTLLGILSFFRGVEILGPTRSSILSMTEPLFTILFSLILFADRLTPFQILGGLGILTGAVLIIKIRG